MSEDNKLYCIIGFHEEREVWCYLKDIDRNENGLCTNWRIISEPDSEGHEPATINTMWIFNTEESAKYTAKQVKEMVDGKIVAVQTWQTYITDGSYWDGVVRFEMPDLQIMQQIKEKLAKLKS